MVWRDKYLRNKTFISYIILYIYIYTYTYIYIYIYIYVYGIIYSRVHRLLCTTGHM